MPYHGRRARRASAAAAAAAAAAADPLFQLKQRELNAEFRYKDATLHVKVLPPETLPEELRKFMHRVDEDAYRAAAERGVPLRVMDETDPIFPFRRFQRPFAILAAASGSITDRVDELNELIAKDAAQYEVNTEVLNFLKARKIAIDDIFEAEFKAFVAGLGPGMKEHPLMAILESASLAEIFREFVENHPSQYRLLHGIDLWMDIRSHVFSELDNLCSPMASRECAERHIDEHFALSLYEQLFHFDGSPLSRELGEVVAMEIARTRHTGVPIELFREPMIDLVQSVSSAIYGQFKRSPDWKKVLTLCRQGRLHREGKEFDADDLFVPPDILELEVKEWTVWDILPIVQEQHDSLKQRLFHNRGDRAVLIQWGFERAAKQLQRVFRGVIGRTALFRKIADAIEAHVLSLRGHIYDMGMEEVIEWLQQHPVPGEFSETVEILLFSRLERLVVTCSPCDLVRAAVHVSRSCPREHPAFPITLAAAGRRIFDLASSDAFLRYVSSGGDVDSLGAWEDGIPPEKLEERKEKQRKEIAKVEERLRKSTRGRRGVSRSEVQYNPAATSAGPGSTGSVGSRDSQSGDGGQRGADGEEGATGAGAMRQRGILLGPAELIREAEHQVELLTEPYLPQDLLLLYHKPTLERAHILPPGLTR